MIKKNWKILVITSIVILLPIWIGLVLWEQLPEQLPIHWNAKGEIDGWCNKPMAVFGLPLIMVALQWVCALVTMADPKKPYQSAKVQLLVFWLVPTISVLLTMVTYLSAMGKEVSVSSIATAFLGFLFIVIGNYLPKCRQSYTVGIRIPWTLASEENWNRTHRLASWFWVIDGILVIVAGMLQVWWVAIGATAVMVLIPICYSYVLYRKGI